MGHGGYGVGAEVKQHFLQGIWIALYGLDIPQRGCDLDIWSVARAENLQGAFDGLIDVGVLQGDTPRSGKGLYALGRPFDSLECFAHHFDVFVQLFVVLDAFADSPQAVLHAVQGIGDLMGNAGHQLADAEHFLLLTKLGVGPIHVIVDRHGEIHGEPHGTG